MKNYEKWQYRYSILLISCVYLSTAISCARDSFDKQAHRGGRGIMPENTIAAMKYALDLGCTLEIDLSYTKDKKVIVSHDNYMSSLFVTDPNGNPVSKSDEKRYRLYNMNYDEIKTFDVGMRPHPEFPDQKKMPATIPLFKELLDSVESYAKEKHLPPPRYNIEAKLAVPVNIDTNAFRHEFINSIVKIIKNKGIVSRSMIQSFDIGMLEILHRNHPDVTISYLVGKNVDLEENLKSLGFTPDIYSPLYTEVTKEMVMNVTAKA